MSTSWKKVTADEWADHILDVRQNWDDTFSMYAHEPCESVMEHVLKSTVRVIPVARVIYLTDDKREYQINSDLSTK